MKRNFFFLLCAFACLALFIAGCGKTGPAGAVGPAGAQGATGPAGSAGPTGPQGNANVMVDTFTLTNSQWLYNSQYSLETSPGSYTEYFTRYHDVTFPAITQGIIDSGMVLVYFVPNPIVSTVNWTQLPFQFLDGSEEFFYDVAFTTLAGKVELDYFFQQVNSGTIPTLSTFNIPTYTFKLVAISGSLAAQMKQGNVDVGNYSQVQHFLNLP